MTATPVTAGFELDVVRLPLAALLPLKTVPSTAKKGAKFRAIVESIREVGVVEPLVVARTPTPAEFLVLDGHVRLTVLGDLGHLDAPCVIATDDEAFTYNKRINRLATIQEHYMIVRALERGVSEEKLARALSANVKQIRRRRALLDGVAPEVEELLKDRSINPTTFDVLRKMRPLRQIEAAELMVTAGNFTASYAKALLAATKQADLVKTDRPKRVAGLSPDQMARMEREMDTLQQDLKAVEASYGDDVLHLVIAAGYVGKLLANPRVFRYLSQRHPELVSELQTIVAATSLDGNGREG